MNFITLLSSLLTPIIAIIVAYIAYQQHLTNRNKLRFELYEKRFKIFNETKQILLKINKESFIDLIELRDFTFRTNESKFLFEKEIPEYLEEIKKKAMELNRLTEKVKRIETIQAEKEIDKKNLLKLNELESWFTNQYQNIEEIFNKYLDFKKI